MNGILSSLFSHLTSRNSLLLLRINSRQQLRRRNWHTLAHLLLHRLQLQATDSATSARSSLGYLNEATAKARLPLLVHAVAEGNSRNLYQARCAQINSQQPNWYITIRCIPVLRASAAAYVCANVSINGHLISTARLLTSSSSFVSLQPLSSAFPN